MTITDEALRKISKERDRQDDKWGVQDHDDEYWLAILGEEFGEVSKAIVERKHVLKKELIHVAAVAIAWWECINRNG